MDILHFHPAWQKVYIYVKMHALNCTQLKIWNANWLRSDIQLLKCFLWAKQASVFYNISLILFSELGTQK